MTVDDRTRDMLDEVARLTPSLPLLTPSQGSYSTAVGASAGTHAGGGAVDIRASNLTVAQTLETVRVMRLVGFAAWRRLPSEGDWPEHIHAIAVGCPDLSPAARQQIDGHNADGDPIGLRNGRNGLANNGPDPHRDMALPVVTWETYLGSRSERGVDMSSPRNWTAADWRAFERFKVRHTDKNLAWHLRRAASTIDRIGPRLMNTVVKHTDKNLAWWIRHLAGESAAIRAELAAQRELLEQLAARENRDELEPAE